MNTCNKFLQIFYFNKYTVFTHTYISHYELSNSISGDLALQTRNLYGGHEGEEEQRVPQVSPPHSLEFGSSSDNERILGLDSGSVDSNMSPKQVKKNNFFKLFGYVTFQ